MGKKVKVLYILANVNKSIAFEWIINNIDSNRFELSFVFLNESKPAIANWCEENHVSNTYIRHLGKFRLITSFIRLVFYLLNKRPTIVHTHLLEANIIGLLAARICFIKKRIHTRHHSTYHHQYFPHAVKYDKWINSLSTHIVAISKVVENILINKEGVNPSKIKLIHHGFKLEEFQKNVSNFKTLKLKYNINDSKSPIIGVISRHLKLKGIQHIIPAIAKLKKNYPDLILILANSTGSDSDYIQEILNEYLKKEDYVKIRFEEDLFALYQLFDVFVHAPINKDVEAFGQTYVEALAAGIPSIFTISGVANEFIKHRYNAMVLDYESSEAIYKSLKKVLENDSIQMTLKKNGLESIQQFDLPIFIKKLEKLYE